MTRADARRRAEEALIPALDHMARLHPLNAEHTEYWGQRLEEARALLAAVPEAPPPPSDAVREAAERLDSLVNRVWSMTPEEAESAGLPTIAKVLRASKRLLSALAASPATLATVTVPAGVAGPDDPIRVRLVPDDAAVREAAERLRTAKRYDIEEVGRWESFRTMVQEPDGDFVEWENVAPLLDALAARGGE